MKKNNKIDNKVIRRQYIKLLVSNMIAFVLVYVILGLSLVAIVNRFFYSDLENELFICKNENEHTISKIQGEYRVNVDNARIKVVLFDADGQRLAYSKDLLNYIIPDYGFNSNLAPEVILTYLDNSDLCKLLDLSNDVKHEKVKLENTVYNFVSLTFEISSKTAPDVKYCKLMIMNNGEISIQNNIIKIFLIISAALIVLGMIASIILSKRTIKPIAVNMEKQTQFVSDASHELRTPLSIVQSKLENILTKTDSTVFDVSEDIAISLKEVSRLNKLTNDLLALTRADNGASVVNFGNYNILETLNDTITIFKEMANIEGKKFEFQIEDFNFSFDKEKIIQLMIILLDNALKYTKEKDLISVLIIKEGIDCIIKVSDTGIGISSEAKKRIFERFYREDKARSRATGGNGLGLAIGKSIVHLHNGKIMVNDNKPKGTIFEIVIPIKNKIIKK